jgi:hypothetical protein
MGGGGGGKFSTFKWTLVVHSENFMLSNVIPPITTSLKLQEPLP